MRTHLPPVFRQACHLVKIGLCSLFLAGGAAHGITIVEDFSYPSGPLNGSGAAGGGWTGSWLRGKSNAVIASENLSIAGIKGYQVTQAGTGVLQRTGGDSSLDVREMAPFSTGEVWFSILTSVASAGRSGLYFNIPTGDQRTKAEVGFVLVGNELRTISGGTMSSGVATISLQTHLIIGKISKDESSNFNTMSLWFTPTDVTSEANLGLSTVTFTPAAGASISNVGIDTYSGGSFDALRIGDSLQSVVIPEPSSVLLVAASGLLLLYRSRRASS